MPLQMTPTINLGNALLAGKIEGWICHLLSPHIGILSEAEAAETIMTFQHRSKAEQSKIRADFIRFFEWLGPKHLVFYSHQDRELENDTEHYCVEMIPELQNASLVQYVDDFLLEKHLPGVFHLQRQCFVSFNFDMSAYITHRAEFSGLPKFDALHWVELP